MQQSFQDNIPAIQSNADGSWPQSAKHKAPRYEVPSGTDQVEVPFEVRLGNRPGPGRVYLIGLMSGPIGRATPIASLAVGAEDQWLVTGHPEVQEAGSKRVSAIWGTSYRIVLTWDKKSGARFVVKTPDNRIVHMIDIGSDLNLDSGARILIGQDVKNPKKLQALHSLPPFGSQFTGVINTADWDAGDHDLDDGDNTGSDGSLFDPRPVDPLSPTPTIPPPPPVSVPPVIKLPKPTNPFLTPPSGGNLVALAPILRAVADQLESGGDIDIQSLLLPILLQLVGGMKGENAQLFAVLIPLLLQRLK